ncbi:transcription factor Opi1 [Backusella circina FSU 941]|nr:transcription factor Opi1 [Backusella circina FSU 941]
MSQQQSPMSITQLVNSPKQQSVDIEDPNVILAAEALGDMARSSTKVTPITLPSLSTPSSTPSSPLPTPEQRLSFSSESTSDEDHRSFMHRVSNIPLVNSALRAYESSKNASYVVKYGAEMVESFATPLYDTLGRRALSGVDEWGCKQLDKLEERYPNYVAPKEEEEDVAGEATTTALARTSLGEDEGLKHRTRDEHVLKSRSRTSSRSTSPHRGITKHRPLARSKWHQIVMHASSAAGTTAAVISEESMKCLRYCLSWLQYASQHIEQQLGMLQKMLASLSSSSEEERSIATQESALSALSQIKKEIIDTLRKVVEVVSKYAGTGLPEQAKASVRGFILALPSRWAILNQSKPGTPVGSPTLKPSDPSSTRIQETSMRLLNFGGESIEMIRSVSFVFSDTIERAELWLSRLRVVGGGRVTRVDTAARVENGEPEQMELN